MALFNYGPEHDWFEWSEIYAPIFEGMLRAEQQAERERRKARKEAS